MVTRQTSAPNSIAVNCACNASALRLPCNGQAGTQPQGNFWPTPQTLESAGRTRGYGLSSAWNTPQTLHGDRQELISIETGLIVTVVDADGRCQLDIASADILEIFAVLLHVKYGAAAAIASTNLIPTAFTHQVVQNCNQLTSRDSSYLCCLSCFQHTDMHLAAILLQCGCQNYNKGLGRLVQYVYISCAHKRQEPQQKAMSKIRPAGVGSQCPW